MTSSRHPPVMDLEEDWDEIRSGARSEDETYVGERDEFGLITVYVELYGVRREMPPNGIGYGWGSGNDDQTMQLAIAILEDAYGQKIALRLYRLFIITTVAKFPEKGWRLKRGQLDEDLKGLTDDSLC